MKTHKKIIIIFLISLFIGCCGVFLWVFLPMVRFYRYQTDSIPKFDALNDSVLNSIPAPEGVKVINQSRMGIDNNLMHGRYLYVDCEMINIEPKDVIQYYHNLLLSNGWIFQHSNQSGNYFSYYKNTSCIDLHTYGKNMHSYTLYIWQDFWKQSFSPPVIPNIEILNILELGYTSFAKCPQ
jgi:hypothetical protein